MHLLVCVWRFVAPYLIAILREISVLNEIAIQDRRPARPTHCFPLGLDDEMWTLMEWCWHRHPTVRPIMQAVMPVLQRLCIGTITTPESENSQDHWHTTESPVHLRRPSFSFSRQKHLPDESLIIQTSERCTELWAKLVLRRENVESKPGRNEEWPSNSKFMIILYSWTMVISTDT